MSGSEKPKFIFVWLVWVESSQRKNTTSNLPNRQTKDRCWFNYPHDLISIGWFLKNGREKRRRHFPNHAPKKVVKPAKVVFRPEKLAANHTGFATFTAFFPVALEKCQFLIALPSVDGSENITRLIMVQRIVSQPMIMLSTGVGELTLSAEW